MRRVDDSLHTSGVLDVAEAIPILNNRVENYTQENFFNKIIEELSHKIAGGTHECDVGYPEYGVEYGLNTTSEEIATITARLMHGPNRWSYIYYSPQHSFCATPG